ncbi:MAG: hypothetical protein OXR82_17570 [Gammaproteobacteria bacterium]|nr:hypothetical protein [Gammaproteobacteria bacterium]
MDERQTMDRILALLNETRERAHVADRFQKQAERFEHEFENIATPDDAYGVRVTAIPRSPDFPRLEKVLDSSSQLVAGLKKPVVQVTREYTFDRPATSLASMTTAQRFTPNWRPLLRAARVEDPDAPSDKRFLFRYLEIHCDGVIEYGLVDNFKRGLAPEPERLSLYGDSVIAQVAVVAGWVDSLREFAGATCAEYAIEVAISARDQPLLVRPWGAGSGGSYYERLTGEELPSGTQLVLGRRYPYTIQGEHQALSPVLLSRVDMDLCHAAGFRYLDGQSLTLTG